MQKTNPESSQHLLPSRQPKRENKNPNQRGTHGTADDYLHEEIRNRRKKIEQEKAEYNEQLEYALLLTKFVSETLQNLLQGNRLRNTYIPRNMEPQKQELAQLAKEIEFTENTYSHIRMPYQQEIQYRDAKAKYLILYEKVYPSFETISHIFTKFIESGTFSIVLVRDTEACLSKPVSLRWHHKIPNRTQTPQDTRPSYIKIAHQVQKAVRKFQASFDPQRSDQEYPLSEDGNALTLYVRMRDFKSLTSEVFKLKNPKNKLSVNRPLAAQQEVHIYELLSEALLQAYYQLVFNLQNPLFYDYENKHPQVSIQLEANLSRPISYGSSISR